MADLTIKVAIQYETSQPYKIELTRSQKGTYGWTVTVHGTRADSALSDLESLDNDLRTDYLPPTPAPEEARPKEES